MLKRKPSLRGAWALGLGAAVAAASSCEPTNQGYAPQQPIKYSHAVHAGAMQIPCQYCHYSAERGRHAGIPPAQICMNCHSAVRPDHPEIVKVKDHLRQGKPIEWVKVHNLPDHVYFDHSIHVQKGVSCEKCHGQIASMGVVSQAEPLTMGWCLGCHREQKGMDRGGPLTECAVCHH